MLLDDELDDELDDDRDEREVLDEEFLSDDVARALPESPSE